MLSEFHNLNLKLCSKQYKKIVLHLIVVPQLSSGRQHDYSTITRQAGWANEQSMYSFMSIYGGHLLQKLCQCTQVFKIRILAKVQFIYQIKLSDQCNLKRKWTLGRELLLKGKAQYDWPPCTKKFRSAHLYIENAIHLCNKISHLNEEVIHGGGQLY
jgi:hypothetical protein